MPFEVEGPSSLAVTQSTTNEPDTLSVHGFMQVISLQRDMIHATQYQYGRTASPQKRRAMLNVAGPSWRREWILCCVFGLFASSSYAVILMQVASSPAF